MKEMLQLFRNKVYARFSRNILERLSSMIAGIILSIEIERIKKIAEDKLFSAIFCLI